MLSLLLSSTRKSFRQLCCSIRSTLFFSGVCRDVMAVRRLLRPKLVFGFVVGGGLLVVPVGYVSGCLWAGSNPVTATQETRKPKLMEGSVFVYVGTT